MEWVFRIHDSSFIIRSMAPSPVPLIFVFNGDADGIIGQHIFGLARGKPDRRVTGLKRDIHLLRALPPLDAARLRVFDISLGQNRPELDALLAKPGVDAHWYDHHDAGEPIAHPRLELHINQGPATCTAVIVDAACGHAHPLWAAMAAFGDNLPATAEALLRAAEAKTPGAAAHAALMARAGVLLNYNAYGETPSDVLFQPADLAARLEPHASALDFARDASIFTPLADQFESDRARCQGLEPLAEGPGAAAFLLPDETWARRYGATWANERALARPEALAVLHPGKSGGYVVSLRAPRGRPAPSAADLAKEFPTGGGRKLAAGINRLEEGDLERFLGRFLEYYRE
jgi:hypothetical protein